MEQQWAQLHILQFYPILLLLVVVAVAMMMLWW